MGWGLNAMTIPILNNVTRRRRGHGLAAVFGNPHFYVVYSGVGTVLVWGGGSSLNRAEGAEFFQIFHVESEYQIEHTYVFLSRPSWLKGITSFIYLFNPRVGLYVNLISFNNKLQTPISSSMKPIQSYTIL